MRDLFSSVSDISVERRCVKADPYFSSAVFTAGRRLQRFSMSAHPFYPFSIGDGSLLVRSERLPFLRGASPSCLPPLKYSAFR